jgi:hypothetical protein
MYSSEFSFTLCEGKWPPFFLFSIVFSLLMLSSFGPNNSSDYNFIHDKTILDVEPEINTTVNGRE